MFLVLAKIQKMSKMVKIHYYSYSDPPDKGRLKRRQREIWINKDLWLVREKIHRTKKGRSANIIVRSLLLLTQWQYHCVRVFDLLCPLLLHYSQFLNSQWWWRTLSIQTTLLHHDPMNTNTNMLPFLSLHRSTPTTIEMLRSCVLSIATSPPSATMSKSTVSIPALSPISSSMQWAPLITSIASSSPAVHISGIITPIAITITPSFPLPYSSFFIFL